MINLIFLFNFLITVISCRRRYRGGGGRAGAGIGKVT